MIAKFPLWPEGMARLAVPGVDAGGAIHESGACGVLGFAKFQGEVTFPT